MKRLLILTILIFSVLFSMTAGESSPPTIAVMDVVATNTSTIKSQVIYEYIFDVVNRRNLYTLVERSALKDAVKEMEISASGMIDDTTAAQIGKLAGAEFILISNLIVDDGITYLSARIVSVETGQVSNTAMLQAGESEYIASLANRTISQLLGQPEGKPGPPADEVVETETEVVEEKAKEEPARVVKKEDPKRMETVLYVLSEVIRCIAISIQFITPDAAGKILDQINVSESNRLFKHLSAVYSLKAGTNINKPYGVFPRIVEDEQMQKVSE